LKLVVFYKSSLTFCSVDEAHCFVEM
jgi:hypothetical protein